MGETRNPYILLRKPEGKTLLGTSRHNIKMDLGFGFG
jgi:hypothetical protein